MSDLHLSGQCQAMNTVLARIGDRWSIQIIYALGTGPMRFNALKRELGITQRVLAQSLRDLERDGLLTRHQAEGSPPRVDYELSALGHSFREPVLALARWVLENGSLIKARQQGFVEEPGGDDDTGAEDAA